MRATIVLVAVTLIAPAAASSQPELIERTLAIVGGQAITLSDVRSALALGLLEVPAGPDQIAVATGKLIDRILVMREVQRYAPQEPSDAAVDARFAEAARRFATPEAYRAALAASGFTEARLRAWARDDLRTVEYLDQRFAAAGIPNDDDVATYFAAHRTEYERTGTTYEQAAPAIRVRLAADRRNELITDWISDLRRRTPVIELFKR